MKNQTIQTLSRVALVASLLAALTMQVVHGAETDISNQPLATRPTVQAKPNLLFISDNSGSMNWSYMPDDLGRSYSVADEPYSAWYGYRAAQCNGTAYDPTMTYDPPLMADGETLYANASFTAAKIDGYSSTSSVTDLTDTYYYTYSGTQTRMGWTYTSDGVVDNTFYRECASDEGYDPGKSVFTQVKMTAASADAQNYANWYSYYRKRYLLMRTAMGRAMANLDVNYRVGFTTINDTGATDGSNHFRDIKDFNTTQKNSFYTSLYSSLPNGSTPLRTALSKAGRYFAKKISGQAHDPVQYACQRNYALLTTDGYWNGGGGVKLDGTSIGQQDGLEARPMRDESIASSTEVIPYSAAATRTRTSNTQTSTRNWSRNKVTVAAAMGTDGCGNTRYHTTVVTQRYTQTRTQYFVTPQASTASYTRTTETTEGVITSGPTDSAVSYTTWSNSAAATTNTTNTGDATAGTIYTDINTSTDCDRSTGLPTGGVIGQTIYTTPTAGSWSSWSPSLTYTNSTPALSAWATGTAVITDTSDNGTANTLADVAQYYYATDLRDSTLSNCTSSSSGSAQNVCPDIVRATTSDPLTKQHMNTFTIGLGLKGTLPHTTDTLDALTAGTTLWPSPTGAESSSSSGGDATNIDDLWHAAINGRGDYYSALSAKELSKAINSVVQQVGEEVGASSAASTSSLELVAGENNFVYRASYTTNSWFGDLEALALNGETAAIASTATWSAKTKLDALTPASRKIYFKGASGLTAFTYANLTAAQKAYFSNICSKPSIPAQCTTMSAADQAQANDGERLVNYLRGDRTHESETTSGATTISALFRTRSHVLGDIINGAPVHVGKPPFSYGDTGYADFVTAKASRKPVVYVAANDGMLHAISAQIGSEGGTELWAYIPTAVMPNMYRMADSNYGNNHQFYVDGAPVMGDIKVGDVWKTILVGGLNRGGASYYALDITDPANPITLWEFTDANMGYSYGNPIITKRSDGTWIVALTSGYNNTSGDGRGHLYILNANTGELLLDLATSAGSAASPSGLSKINAWVDDPSDNTALRFYGGDLEGNVWRFDINNLYEPHQAALKLAELKHTDGTPQPITTKPMTVEISNKPVVVVATGRYLGETDISDTTRQSVYAIKDPLTNAGWGNVRTNTEKFVEQTLTVTFVDTLRNNVLNGVEDADEDATASVSENAVDWSSKGGWRVDFPHNGERVFSNMGLQLGTLVMGTAVPSGDACASGGSSWRYYLNVGNGSKVADNPVGVKWSPLALIVGISWIKDTEGNVRIIYQQSDSTIRTEIPPTAPSSGTGSAHRTSWRELAD